MDYVCPTCNESYKSYRRGMADPSSMPLCKKCGSSLLPLGGTTVWKPAGLSPAEMLACPRCGFHQPRSPRCVRCGVDLSGPMGDEEELQPESSPDTYDRDLGKVTRTSPFGAGAGMLLVVFFALFFILQMIVRSEPYRAAKHFLKGREEVRDLVGEDVSLIPLPMGSVSFGERESKVEFNFWAKGSAGSSRLRVSLTKSQGRWQVVSASYTDRDGTARPIPVKRARAGPMQSERAVPNDPQALPKPRPS